MSHDPPSASYFLQKSETSSDQQLPNQLLAFIMQQNSQMILCMRIPFTVKEVSSNSRTFNLWLREKRKIKEAKMLQCPRKAISDKQHQEMIVQMMCSEHLRCAASRNKIWTLKSQRGVYGGVHFSDSFHMQSYWPRKTTWPVIILPRSNKDMCSRITDAYKCLRSISLQFSLYFSC